MFLGQEIEQRKKVKDLCRAASFIQILNQNDDAKWLVLLFFTSVCAQSFYRSSTMIRAKDLYTSGPHGLLDSFITELMFPAVLACTLSLKLPHFNKTVQSTPSTIMLLLESFT